MTIQEKLNQEGIQFTQEEKLINIVTVQCPEDQISQINELIINEGVLFNSVSFASETMKATLSVGIIK